GGRSARPSRRATGQSPQDQSWSSSQPDHNPGAAQNLPPVGQPIRVTPPFRSLWESPAVRRSLTAVTVVTATIVSTAGAGVASPFPAATGPQTRGGRS